MARISAFFRQTHHFIKKSHPNELKNLWERHDRYLGPGFMLLGFIFDSLTLTRIDLWLDNLILLAYISIVGLAIFIMNANDAGRFKNRFTKGIAEWAPLIMQFAFGGLFSGLVVFYSRSTSIIANWPFVLTLAFLLVGNEFFKERYQRLIFQLSIFYVAVFSYLTFAIPVVLKEMGVLVFLLSGLLSLLIMRFFMYLMSFIAPWKLKFNQRAAMHTTVALFVAFNGLYFTNVIPPIPLSLKESGIYHNIQRTSNNEFVLQYEEAPWWKFWRSFDSTYHRFNDEPIYAYTAVFAPTNLRQDIVHEWSYFDTESNEWIVSSVIAYPIVGGRDGGYRGFSLKRGVFPGKWRVDVETRRGQLLGRMEFTVVESNSPPELKTTTE